MSENKKSLVKSNKIRKTCWNFFQYCELDKNVFLLAVWPWQTKSYVWGSIVLKFNGRQCLWRAHISWHAQCYTAEGTSSGFHQQVSFQIALLCYAFTCCYVRVKHYSKTTNLFWRNKRNQQNVTCQGEFDIMQLKAASR